MNRFSTLAAASRARFMRLHPREQRAVVLLGSIILALGFWLGIWQPLQEAKHRAVSQYHTTRADLDWMRAHANAIPQAPSIIVDTRPLLSIASEVAAPLQLTFSQAEPLADGGLKVLVANGSFNQLVLWLDTMQRTHGVTASQLTITRQVEPGMVDATLTLTTGR